MTLTDTTAATARPPGGGDGGPLPRHVETAVIGTGFGGLGTAIQLKRAGRDDFVLLERAGGLGGTWRDNTYPGCACDVPSHLYSFSFAPNPDWSRAFSPQAEIQAYLEDTARRFGVLPHLRFHAEVLDARWDAATQRWHLTTARGELTARFLIAAAGPLSEPSIPSLPGAETFAGTTFHSATWDHDHDLRGERVAVIGTGASAIQFVPEVQKVAGHLTVFQRTAPWVLPRKDRAYGATERALFRRVPLAMKAVRSGIYWGRESWIVPFAKKPDIMKLGERQALRHLRSQVADPELRRKLRPTYRLGCKRVLLSNDYYPALTQPNVDVVTDRISEIVPTGIVTTDEAGNRTEHPVDTIIYGTGFRATDPPIAERIRGADGRTLAESWATTGAQALRGLTVAGYPNLFFLVGPNTGLGHTSIVFMIEAQIHYILDAMRALDAGGGGSLEPRREVQDAYNARLQGDLAGTVWNAGGCASYYLDAAGRNPSLWPTFTFTYWRETRRCDLSEYVVTPRVPQPVVVAA